jgi:hypothetical protein
MKLCNILGSVPLEIPPLGHIHGKLKTLNDVRMADFHAVGHETRMETSLSVYDATGRGNAFPSFQTD